ncbi:hypothetical protein C8R47DRAFT_449930 [Mycena vitilis]|nr:hypothetical protein C8R47DRAFT_449930 [Mycena vitilis]
MCESFLVLCSLERSLIICGSENLTQRARALQNKQRSGHVAPPTPSANTGNGDDAFSGARRRASMVVPDFTPLGKRAMPPRISHHNNSSASASSGRARLPMPVSIGAPFSALPPTPEPARRRRVPGSLMAPRYSHLLEEAVAVSGGPAPKAREEEQPEESGEDASFEDGQQDQSIETDQYPDESFDTDADAEMAPTTPLREREARLQHPATQPAAPATIGKRVKGFLFSYLPTLAKTAPPPRAARSAHPSRPGLPLPPLELLQKPRGPVTTPVRPPLPKTRAPKELVDLQPAPLPPPKSALPRRVPPRRLVDLNHVSPPPEQPDTRVGPRPRTSSGGSVKDLVKNFEAVSKSVKGAEVKRVRSVGDFGGNNNGKRPGVGGGAARPMWRP